MYHVSEYIKEEVTFPKNIPARIYLQHLRGEECYTPLHWHHEIEINQMLSGEANFTVNGNTTRISAGDIFLVNSEDVHMGEIPRELPVEAWEQELITILLDYDFLKNYVEAKGTLRFDLNQCDAAIRGQIQEWVTRIGILYASDDSTKEMEITAMLLLIGTLLLKNCAVPVRQLQKDFPFGTVKIIQDAVTYIETHFRDDITLKEIANHSGLAPTYFSKKFRQATGTTYSNYLGRCRLKGAVKDLQNTELSINDIAFQNGFPNVKSFITAFKNEFQTTPLQYRKNKRLE